MRQLISKLIAAGLSAGVVLLWWPIVMQSNGAASWVLRAVVWTLLFESLLALLAPIEESLWENLAPARRLASRMLHVRARLYDADGSDRRRLVNHAVVALVVAAIPLGLIAEGPEPQAATPVVVKRPVQKVIHVTKVVRVRDDSGSGDTRSNRDPVATRPTSTTDRTGLTPRRGRARERHSGSAPRPAPVPPSSEKRDPASDGGRDDRRRKTREPRAETPAPGEGRGKPPADSPNGGGANGEQPAASPERGRAPEEGAPPAAPQSQREPRPLAA